MRRIALIGTVLAATLAAAGCGGTHQASIGTLQTTTKQAAGGGAGASTPALTRPAGDANPCLPVAGGLLREIRSQIVLDRARVSHARAVATAVTPGYYFVSARVKGGGGNGLATWVAHGLGSHATVYAVDSFAALVSNYGAAAAAHPTLTLTTPGAYRSRVCAGGPHASAGAPAPLPGSAGPAGS